MDSVGDGSLITVHIKTPKNKETVQTAPNASVKQFKELVSQKFNAQSDKICLIFSGKILKDEETLDKLDIKDGLTVSCHSILVKCTIKVEGYKQVINRLFCRYIWL